MSRYGSQRAVREQEASKLSISGIDLNGKPFQEESNTIDISETGISFYLKTSVWMDAHLNLEIRSSTLLGPVSSLKAKVVRFGAQEDGRRFIGARFD
ncbi:MAG: PilZ domain-containing protein [Acidobacteria bacterium]|nr:PilZ domain-containing protein [Acidobacteriota bacterium]MCI0621453.1 PilZ domain-containing protein [Acidobacteriota bacterium]MCI0720471.1 PilZ domain-containing protein [Acidobacteriota bacterium]